MNLVHEFRSRRAFKCRQSPQSVTIQTDTVTLRRCSSFASDYKYHHTQSSSDAEPSHLSATTVVPIMFRCRSGAATSLSLCLLDPRNTQTH
ncbi:hypothetical protein HanRHA438_Chr04g0150391 [Helianthus annuus]|nr:hypothetical protein HanHA89_Chr04g0127281 [Helianthus annuus]KAJ0924605.1 hypothetical protein HanRHA438_Chr04g0150391 [Helianthus annuus]